MSPRQIESQDLIVVNVDVVIVERGLAAAVRGLGQTQVAHLASDARNVEIHVGQPRLGLCAIGVRPGEHDGQRVAVHMRRDVIVRIILRDDNVVQLHG